jgi:hypothetical protein
MTLTDDQIFKLSFDFFTHRGNSWGHFYESTSIHAKGAVDQALIGFVRAAIALEKQQESTSPPKDP